MAARCALFRALSALFRALVALVSAMVRLKLSSQPRGVTMDPEEEEATAIYPVAELEEDFMFTEILTKLPAKSLMRFKRVSKSWSVRISGDLSFAEAHLNQQRNNSHMVILGPYYFLWAHRQRMTLHSVQGLKTKEVDVAHVAARHGSIEIVGSSNGLVCLLSARFGWSQTPNSLLLWNPTTRQVRKLPNTLANNARSFGFGFDGASGDYKIVYLATKGLKDKPLLAADVFAKSGTVWRSTAGKRGRILPSMRAAEANGALHWVALARVSGHKQAFVLSFGLSDEVLRLNYGPGGNKWCLCSWRDSLAAVAPSKEGGGYVMWEANGRDLHWRKLFNIRIITARITFRPFAVGTLLYQNYHGDADIRWAITEGPIYWRVSYSNNYIESIISVF